MLKPEKMLKVTIIGTKENMGHVVNKLHELRLLHIEDYKKSQKLAWLDIGSPSENASETAQKLLNKFIKIAASNSKPKIKPKF